MPRPNQMSHRMIHITEYSTTDDALVVDGDGDATRKDDVEDVALVALEEVPVRDELEDEVARVDDEHQSGADARDREGGGLVQLLVRHVQQLPSEARASGFSLLSYAEIIPRMESGVPVQGHLFVFESARVGLR